MATRQNTPIASTMEVPIQQVVDKLIQELGSILVSAIGRGRLTTSAQAWSAGTEAMSPDTQMRLRLAYWALEELGRRECYQTARTFFWGENPRLGNVEPFHFIREATLPDDELRVRAAVMDVIETTPASAV